MPGLIGFGTPIIIVTQLDFNIRSRVEVVGQGWGGDRFEEEIRFHPRGAVIDGEVGGDGCSAGCGRAVCGVKGQLRP